MAGMPAMQEQLQVNRQHCVLWRSATLCGMAKNIRISDSLYRLAQLEAVLESRSIAQQIEYWAKRGMVASRGVAEDRIVYGDALEATLQATRRLDILDVASGARQAKDLHFIPASVARESKIVAPRTYRKSKGG
jgi:hypothetical protein